MIALGAYDANVGRETLNDYIERANALTGVEGWAGKLRGDKDGEWVDFQELSGSPMTVVDAQRFLKSAGFFPFGKEDGICGYRTASAIRLFQEYLRTVEGNSQIGFPDGKMGPVTISQANRWKTNSLKADWTRFSAASPSEEYAGWMSLLERVKEKYVTTPNLMLGKVNAFPKPSDTVKVENWAFEPDKIHLIGIRRNVTEVEANPGDRKFDDAFVLLIRGVAFKFMGSTDPGLTENVDGLPFLTQGQHLYRFGWHKLSDMKRVYHALKPLSSGVLVVRSKDTVLNEADIARGLERNNTINVHWGGEGLRSIGNWSVGCQVIVGKGYINQRDADVNCSEFAAASYSDLGQKNAKGVYQTKGAYSVLEDLVAALSGAGEDDNVLRYMLIYEEDLALRPELGAGKAKEIVARIQSLPA
jgi:hypothetical protein